MGIIVSKNNDENSRLNQRINADLRERLQKSELGDDPDFVEDSDLLVYFDVAKIVH